MTNIRVTKIAIAIALQCWGTLAFTQSNQTHFIYGINAGSQSSAEMEDKTFLSDRFFTGGTENSTTDPIAAISDDSVFQSERYGDIQYDIPVSSGRYTVILHMTEMYHDTAGMRAFNVSVENQPVIQDLDMFELVGHDTAFEFVIEDMQVTDGSLTISFETVLDNAQVCGISIYSVDGGRVLE